MTVMNVFVGQERVTLDDAQLLGVGGEGRVYRWRDRALKIFHDASSGLVPADKAARAAKSAKVRAFPRPLPRGVVGPLEIAEDDRGETVGFTMRLVDGATDAMRLAQRRWREGVMSNGEVIAIFRALRDLLLELHARGMVVGDLNDGNVLFQGSTPWLIDADSMQFGPFACTVAHERFLDPRLYGRDLAASPAFTPFTDWYAFTVMLFASLSYVHPYGGQHATLPTMLRRAEARHSVLRRDVKPPRSATPLDALPDSMLDWFGGVFDRDQRGTVPEALLDVRWTRCACGLEHARARCPGCARAQATRVPVSRGRLRVAEVLRRRGRVLACTLQGALRFAYEEDGRIVREDGARVTAASPGARVVIDGAFTWIGRGDRVALWRREVQERALTVSIVRGEPAFDANAFGCVYADGALLKSATTGKHIGSILDSQTWFRLGDRHGFGFYRGGKRAFGFLFRAERGGLITCTVPALDGRVVDASAFFDDDRVLFGVATEREGRRTHALHLFDARGALVASASGSPEDRPILESIHGKCLAFGTILSSTDDGLLLARVDAGARRIVEEKVFPETRDVVSAASELVAAPGGALYVANEREILHLSLH
jgi:hypothetical protein